MEAQGYLFGRPAPIEEFVPLISESVVTLSKPRMSAIGG
jgi:hypothetical protein